MISVSMVSTIQSQNVDLPQRNQRAKIAQRLGLTWISIEYSSPQAREESSVFGTRIPYGAMWGAGARENTVIEFEHDVLFEGKSVKAGKYGMFMIPGKEEFQIVLSKYYHSWSQTYPTEQETVLKVSVTPKEIPFKKWLSYDFVERDGQYVIAMLEWEKIGVPFKIEINNPSKVVFESLIAEMKGRGQFLWGANYDAANNLNFMDIHLDQAMIWVDKSLDLEQEDGWRRGLSLWLKAKLLIKKDKEYTEEAKKHLRKSITLINNSFDLNSAVILLAQNNDYKFAIEGAERLVSEFQNDPFIWAFTDTLAEVYLKNGNKKKALKYYKLAKSKAPKNRHAYFDETISKIKNKR